MATASRSRAADRAGVIKKLVPLLKKQYKVPVSNHDRTVLDTMLYAVCLENVSVPVAEASFATLLKEFPDLNEARVSSITELQRIFAGQVDPDWRAFRIRSILQFVFEKSFTYEFEGLRKKTLELAQKQLAKVRHLTPFIRNYTLHYAIGAHVLPLDDYSLRALNWLGLATADQSADEISESFRATIRKAEAEQFCYSVRALATDPEVAPTFDPEQFPSPTEGWDAVDGIERLQSLLKHGFAAYKLKYGISAAKVEKAPKGEKSVTDKATTEKQISEKAGLDKAAAEKAHSEKTAPEKAPAEKVQATTAKQSGEKPGSQKSGKFEKPAKAVEPVKSSESQKIAVKAAPKKSAPEAKPTAVSKTSATTSATSGKAAAKSGKFEKPVAGKPAVDKSSNESGKLTVKKVEPKKAAAPKDAPAAKASAKSGTHAKPSATTKATSSKASDSTKKPATKKSK